MARNRNNLPDRFLDGMEKIADSLFSIINTDPVEDPLTFREYSEVLDLMEDLITAQNHLRNIKNMNYVYDHHLRGKVNEVIQAVDQFNEYMFTEAKMVDEEYEEF